MKEFVLAFLLSIVPLAAHAELVARPGPQDPRVRTVPYSASQVYALTGTYGMITTILFGEDEEVLTVTVGDSVSWQIVLAANKRVLNIKPMEDDAPTNMSVITTRRTYSFELLVNTSKSKREQTYTVRFIYPENAGLRGTAEMWRQAAEATKNPNIRNLRRDKVNFDYGFKGSDAGKPSWVFDDGVKTFMQFTGDIPAIFVVDKKNRESLVNYRREGDYIVIDAVSRQWSLRLGEEAETCLFNLRTSPAVLSTPVEGAVAPRRLGRAGAAPATIGANR